MAERIRSNVSTRLNTTTTDETLTTQKQLERHASEQLRRRRSSDCEERCCLTRPLDPPATRQGSRSTNILVTRDDADCDVVEYEVENSPPPATRRPGSESTTVPVAVSGCVDRKIPVYSQPFVTHVGHRDEEGVADERKQTSVTVLP